MKKIIVMLAVIAVIAAGCDANGMTENLTGGAKGSGADIGQDATLASFQLAAAGFPSEALSDAERAGLVKLREEEKLARDVYAFLADTWKIKVFTNISASEETHMGYVKTLLDKYGIDDPVKDGGRGIFSDPEFTKLYGDLTSKGSASLLDAVSVGLLIEELDIKDVKDSLAAADNADVRVLLLNLEKGSRNHLRAFNRQLERNGGVYTPSFLSAEEIQSILGSSDRGTGMITDPNFSF